MIIPKIDLANLASNESSLAELAERITDWNLFGCVAITGARADHLDLLEQALLRVGGFVDLQIELKYVFNEDEALKLLNAGASTIICSRDDLDRISGLPADRIQHVMPDETPDEAIPKNHVVTLDHPSAERIAELEMARVDAWVAAEHLEQHPELIADFFQAVLVTDRPDGLWSTVIVDPLGVALGLAYSNYESLLHAIEHRCGTYWSRSRDDLWVKGESSGATQKLLGIRLDCDRDCLRFQVTQDPPGFCHRNLYTCFGHQRTIESVLRRLSQRINDSDEKSFTRKLANDAKMLETKLLEEAQELSEASQSEDQQEIAWEAADVLYFSLVAMLKNGVSLDQVVHELCRRMNRVVRRKNKLEPDSEKDIS